MIQYSNHGVRIAECYFDEDPAPCRADVLRVAQSPVRRPATLCNVSHSLAIDLRRSDKELLAAMHSGTRYEVRRGATKDGLKVEVAGSPSLAAISEFCEFYDHFARNKQVPLANRRKLVALSQCGGLVLSAAFQEDGAPLVRHAYIRFGGWVRLLYSASFFREDLDQSSRQLTGRANRYLHWAEMLEFKSTGIELLDFGGWYDGATDQERLRINAFKAGFGGEKVTAFNCYTAFTLKGKAALLAFEISRRGGK